MKNKQKNNNKQTEQNKKEIGTKQKREENGKKESDTKRKRDAQKRKKEVSSIPKTITRQTSKRGRPCKQTIN